MKHIAIISLFIIALLFVSGCTLLDDFADGVNEKTDPVNDYENHDTEPIDNETTTDDIINNDTEDNEEDTEPEEDEIIQTSGPCPSEQNGDRYYCITEDAIAAKDIKICEQIPVTEEDSFKRCIKIVASNVNKKTICDQLQTTEGRELCKTAVAGAASNFYS